MSRARLSTAPMREYEIVQLTDSAEWVLSDEHDDIRMFVESSTWEHVEVCCDFCGRWSTDAAPVVAGSFTSWMCLAGTGPCPAGARRAGTLSARTSWRLSRR